MNKYEKEIKNIIEERTSLRINIDFFWELPNYYGDRHDNSWGFLIAPLNKKKIKNLDDYLVKAGLNPVNIWVGSYIHGWIHRIIYKKEENYLNYK